MPLTLCSGSLCCPCVSRIKLNWSHSMCYGKSLPCQAQKKHAPHVEMVVFAMGTRTSSSDHLDCHRKSISCPCWRNAKQDYSRLSSVLGNVQPTPSGLRLQTCQYFQKGLTGMEKEARRMDTLPQCMRDSFTHFKTTSIAPQTRDDNSAFLWKVNSGHGSVNTAICLPAECLPEGSPEPPSR